MRKDYKKRLDMNLRQWLIYHQKTIVFDKCYWMGVRALKNPFDSWIYQEIIYEVKPEVIVEIGSYEGGSTLYLANLLDLLGKGQVISIDIDRTNFKVKHDRIIVITGDCSSQEIAGKVSQLCQGKRTLVIHDGDHSKNAVLRDLAIYSKLVSVGSYLIVEDGIVDLFKPGDSIGRLYEGPLKAVDEFLRSNTDFIVDMEREKYILTYNPRGFLKRIR
jgi:cephalosporin hydroxylase